MLLIKDSSILETIQEAVSRVSSLIVILKKRRRMARHTPKLDLASPFKESSPIPTNVHSPEGLRYLCKKCSRADILDILNNLPITSGALQDSPTVYRPAQLEAARAGRISILEDLLARGCPLFDGNSGETVPEAAVLSFEEIQRFLTSCLSKGVGMYRCQRQRCCKFTSL